MRRVPLDRPGKSAAQRATLAILSWGYGGGPGPQRALLTAGWHRSSADAQDNRAAYPSGDSHFKPVAVTRGWMTRFDSSGAAWPEFVHAWGGLHV